MQNPFADSGGASSVKYLLEDLGSDIVGIDSQLTLTPFQRQVLEAAKAKEAEEKKKEREEIRQQNQPRQSGPKRNPRAGAGSSAKSGKNQVETVRYVNKKLNPDHEVHDN